jgi:hypothetical protein
MSFSANYPTSRPALNLNFARSKVLDPRITFTRASTATYYDGVTTAKAEENLLPQSQDFTNATYWATNTASVSYTANTTAAPDGTMTADTMTAAVGTGTRFGSGTGIYGITSGLVYTASLFVQAGTDTVVQLLFPTGQFGSDAYANFDLSAGTVGSVGASATATISSAGGTWYRCSITATATASSTASIGMGFVFTGNNSSAARLPSITTAGTETLILWGAQLEQRDAVTSYTATTTQQITNYIPVLLTAANNVPRFDHNPTTGESLGLLIEEQRTNLILRSEEFDNASWTKAASSITANTIVAPDGVLTGDRFVENSAAAVRSVSQTSTTVASTTYTLSVFAKEVPTSAKRYLRLALNTVASTTFWAAATYDLSLGTVLGTNAAGGGTVTSTSITAVGNGWYRCVLTGDIGSNTDMNVVIGCNPSIGTYTNRGRESYTGDGYSGIYIWGAQLEVGAFPTSYIKTVAATATRSADAASMTGTNFSSWYNQSEGTVFTEAQNPLFAASGSTDLYSINTDANNRILAFLAIGTLNYRAQIWFSGSIVFSQNIVSSANITDVNKTVFAYKTNNSVAYGRNTNSDDTNCTIPVVVRLEFGASGSAQKYIRRFAYYPTRLTNAQLQALTS